MTTPLLDAVRRYTDERGAFDGPYSTPISGLHLVRSTRTFSPFPTLYRPSLCMAVQGVKRVEVMDQVFEFGAMQALIVSAEIPALGGITRASEAAPFLGLTLELDGGMLREVAEQLGPQRRPQRHGGLGASVGHVEGPLADCLLRLVRLLRTPEAIPVLLPAITRELSYWLLTGEAGHHIGHLALPDANTQRVIRAIHWLRAHMGEPLRVEALAAEVEMSPSSFHEHFKRLTSTTPLQYQKQLRLLEARRLMVAEGATVTAASFGVGYESVSQFSREYSRLFGAAPKRDAMGLRAAPMMA